MDLYLKQDRRYCEFLIFSLKLILVMFKVCLSVCVFKVCVFTKNKNDDSWVSQRTWELKDDFFIALVQREQNVSSIPLKSSSHRTCKFY